MALDLLNTKTPMMPATPFVPWMVMISTVVVFKSNRLAAVVEDATTEEEEEVEGVLAKALEFEEVLSEATEITAFASATLPVAQAGKNSRIGLVSTPDMLSTPMYGMIEEIVSVWSSLITPEISRKHSESWTTRNWTATTSE